MTNENLHQHITYALAASPDFAQDGVCFAARGSGLCRSDDGGYIWRSAYAALDLKVPLATMAVVVSPDFVSDQSVFAGVAGGVLRSFDGGQNWHTATLSSPPPVVSAMVISPGYAHDGTLLAGTLEDGVFRSADRGQVWEAWNFGLLDLNVLCMAISPNYLQDETLFVGTETGVFRSTNGGRAWREVDFATELAPVLSLALSPTYADDGLLFAGTESSGLFRSDDQGHTWVRLGRDSVGETVNAIVVSPKFPAQADILALADDALLLSHDGGRSWSDWRAGVDLGSGGACMAAPQGLDPGAPLLIGLAKGGVLRI